MEQNETGFQAPQAPILCVNNCGFFGTASTMNMCSKCFKDLVLKEEQATLAASSIQSIVYGTSSACQTDSTISAMTTADPAVTLATTVEAAPQASSSLPPTAEAKEVKEGPKRCGCCKKRVGLTGFNCRCSGVFCSIHRYSDKHECPFDYRSAGQEAIAKANPVVKADKLDKI